MTSLKAILIQLACCFVLLTVVSSTPVPTTPSMRSTGRECSSISKQGFPPGSSACQVKEMAFEFTMDGCEPVEKCMTVCSGVCEGHNRVISESPFKSLHCPKCVPRKNYKTKDLTLTFKCEGERKVTKEVTLEHRKIQKCRCGYA